MSYTAPTYVDTKEQAILALASTIKGEAVTGGDGSVNRALDILADTLAEQDVQVPQTDAGAILALAQYAHGGGGGGVNLGTISMVLVDEITVDAGDEISGGGAVVSISVGGQKVTDVTDDTLSDFTLGTAAAGATVEAIYQYIDDESYLTDVVFRWATVDTNTYKYVTISDPIDLAATTSAKTVNSSFCCVAEFVMPEPPTDGACLLLSAEKDDTQE